LQLAEGGDLAALHCQQAQTLIEALYLTLALNRQFLVGAVCALNGKYTSFRKEFPEGASPLCIRVTPGSISKSQGGLG